jgi:hypothetical protein
LLLWSNEKNPPCKRYCTADFWYGLILDLIIDSIDFSKNILSFLWIFSLLLLLKTIFVYYYCYLFYFWEYYFH